MTDLRKAAKIALECIDYHWDNPDNELENWSYVVEAKQALRKALDKPDIDPQALVQMAVLAEREACAKIVEAEASQYVEPTWAFEIINDIKARGER